MSRHPTIIVSIVLLGVALACSGKSDTEFDCFDAIDNDGDGWLDCDDSDCNCVDDETYTPNNGSPDCEGDYYYCDFNNMTDSYQIVSLDSCGDINEVIVDCAPYGCTDNNSGNYADCCAPTDSTSCKGDEIWKVDECGVMYEQVDDCSDSGNICVDGACQESHCQLYIELSNSTCNDVENVYFVLPSRWVENGETVDGGVWPYEDGVTIECEGHNHYGDSSMVSHREGDEIDHISCPSDGSPVYYVHDCQE